MVPAPGQYLSLSEDGEEFEVKMVVYDSASEIFNVDIAFVCSDCTEGDGDRLRNVGFEPQE